MGSLGRSGGQRVLHPWPGLTDGLGSREPGRGATTSGPATRGADRRLRRGGCGVSRCQRRRHQDADVVTMILRTYASGSSIRLQANKALVSAVCRRSSASPSSWTSRYAERSNAGERPSTNPSNSDSSAMRSRPSALTCHYHIDIPYRDALALRKRCPTPASSQLHSSTKEETPGPLTQGNGGFRLGSHPNGTPDDS